MDATDGTVIVLNIGPFGVRLRFKITLDQTSQQIRDLNVALHTTDLELTVQRRINVDCQSFGFDAFFIAGNRFPFFHPFVGLGYGKRANAPVAPLATSRS